MVQSDGRVMLSIEGQGRPPSDDYQVYWIGTKCVEDPFIKVTYAYVTIYDNGRITYELDSDRLYISAELTTIQSLARLQAEQTGVKIKKE